MTKAEARAKARALWRQWDAAALRTMGGRMAHELFARPEWRQARAISECADARRAGPVAGAGKPPCAKASAWPCRAPPTGAWKPCGCAALTTLRRGLTASASRSGAKFWRRRFPRRRALALVPCLAAGADGVRLGRGGGYYDRFLAQYKGRSLLVCPAALTLAGIPAERWDARFAPEQRLTGGF